MRTMVRKLLIERLSLKYHKEKKEIPVYAVPVTKGGPKIKPEAQPLPGPAFGGAPQRGFQGRGATMAEFASIMQSQFMDLPVVDQTGLGDTRYTFVLKFTPDPTMRLFGGLPTLRRLNSPATALRPTSSALWCSNPALACRRRKR